MTGLHRTPLTTSQKVECAALAVAGQDAHGTLSALSREYDLSRPTVYEARAAATLVLELATLNAYFELMAAAVTARGGEILRFIGHAMLIVLPTDERISVSSTCEAATDAALDAFSALDARNHRRRRAGDPTIGFGVGLPIGEVTCGNVGAPNRLVFTVMGPAVNRTARIESPTKNLGPPLLMSEEFARALEGPASSLGKHTLKGVGEVQEIFALADD